MVTLRLIPWRPPLRKTRIRLISIRSTFLMALLSPRASFPATPLPLPFLTWRWVWATGKFMPPPTLLLTLCTITAAALSAMVWPPWTISAAISPSTICLLTVRPWKELSGRKTWTMPTTSPSTTSWWSWTPLPPTRLSASSRCPFRTLLLIVTIR